MIKSYIHCGNVTKAKNFALLFANKFPHSVARQVPAKYPYPEEYTQSVFCSAAYWGLQEPNMLALRTMLFWPHPPGITPALYTLLNVTLHSNLLQRLLQASSGVALGSQEPSFQVEPECWLLQGHWLEFNCIFRWYIFHNHVPQSGAMCSWMQSVLNVHCHASCENHCGSSGQWVSTRQDVV